jgi:hypothetical protein
MVYQSNLPSQTLFDSGVISLCFTSGFRFKLSQISGSFCKILGNVGTIDRIGFALQFLVMKSGAKCYSCYADFSRGSLDCRMQNWRGDRCLRQNAEAIVPDRLKAFCKLVNLQVSQ